MDWKRVGNPLNRAERKLKKPTTVEDYLYTDWRRMDQPLWVDEKKLYEINCQKLNFGQPCATASEAAAAAGGGHKYSEQDMCLHMCPKMIGAGDFACLPTRLPGTSDMPGVPISFKNILPDPDLEKRREEARNALAKKIGPYDFPDPRYHVL